MRIAILDNAGSEGKSERAELIESLRSIGGQCYAFGQQGSVVHPYYGADTAEFVPIAASRYNTNPFKEIASICSVRKQIKKNRIDAAVIYGIKNHAAMAIGAKLGGAKRIVCVVNGSGNLFCIPGIKGKLLRFMAFPMLKIAYALCSGIGFQNRDDKALFLEKRLLRDDEKVFLTNGSGVNLEEFPPQPMAAENRFLFLARITPTKGILEYIEAAKIVKKAYPDAVFDVVGPLDAAVEDGVEELVREAHREGSIAYHGTTSDVRLWTGRCRFFVYPSYYHEGVPRCTMQALASARPVITCDSPGCRETVGDGVNGFLVPPQNGEAIAEKMIWLIEHPEQAEAMGKASRALAEDKFDVREVNKILMDRLIKETKETKP